MYFWIINNRNTICNNFFIDHIDDLKNSIVSLENSISKLEEEKQESINKLNILTKFFKEQEKEYLKYVNFFL